LNLTSTTPASSSIAAMGDHLTLPSSRTRSDGSATESTSRAYASTTYATHSRHRSSRRASIQRSSARPLATLPRRSRWTVYSHVLPPNGRAGGHWHRGGARRLVSARGDRPRRRRRRRRNHRACLGDLQFRWKRSRRPDVLVVPGGERTIDGVWLVALVVNRGSHPIRVAGWGAYRAGFEREAHPRLR
jgi:hypothetical protein